MKSYEVIVVDVPQPMLRGVYIRQKGELEQCLKVCPLAFDNDLPQQVLFGQTVAHLLNKEFA